MPCSIQRSKGKIEKVAKGGNRFLSKTSLEHSKQKTFLKDREVSELVQRNSDQRYVLVTFVALDPDVRWKVVAPIFLPLKGPDQRNQLGSGSLVKMEGLDLVPLPPAITFHVDPQSTQRSHPPEHTYSANSLTSSRTSGSNFLQHSQTMTSMNKKTKAAKISGSSTQQDSFMNNGTPELTQDDSNVNVLAQQVNNTSKISKAVKKTSRKKGKKKGKQLKKPLCSTDSTEPEALCEEGVCSSSTSESCANNDWVSGVGLVTENRLTENAIVPVVCLQENTVNKNGIEHDNGDLFNRCATTRVCTSYNGEVNESEAVVPLQPQESTGEHFPVYPDCQVKAMETLFSTYDRETMDTCLKGIGASLEVFSDISSTPVLDSFSDGWNSDYSTNGGDDEEKSSVREGDGNNPLESFRCGNSGSLLHNTRKECPPHGNSSKRTVDAYNLAERMKSGTQGCSSSDGNSSIPGKRSKKERKLSGHRLSGNGCLQGRTGKENNHSVWRKVQRNDADGHLCEPKNVDSVDLQFETASKEAPLLKRGSNASDSAILKSEGKDNLKVKISEKLKKKPSACLKSELKYNPRNGVNACKITSNRPASGSMQQKEASDIPFKVHSTSNCQIECVSTNLQADKVDCIPLERIRTSQGCPEGKNQYGSVRIINDQAEQNQSSASSKSIASLDKSNLLEAQSDLHLPTINRSATPERDNPPEEYNIQENNCGSILQKWVPVGRKDADLKSMRIPANASVLPVEEVVKDQCASHSNAEEELSSSSETPLPLMDVNNAFLRRDTGNISGSLSDDEGRILKPTGYNNCMSIEQSKRHDLANHVSTDPSKNCRSSAFETDSIKIIQAVNDAYRLQLDSEAVQFATGSPLAEFEKLLHSASPVVAQRYSIQHCQTCLQEQVGASLCRHQMPNVSLGGLWQWYEKHGNYGLEVKVDDYLNSKRLGIDRFEFRAYFVPFLSAVQLFSKCQKHPMNNSTGTPCPEVSEASEIDDASESPSHIGQDPIFSVLIPQPCRQDDKCSSQHVSLSCQSEPSSTHVRDLLNDHSFGPACCDDPELLFQYFEAEQPQQRRPLFERVKELVRGGNSNCQAYGDPTVLNSLGLHDLHPSSWYSVAWYPIYRIPDGNFRAAFLTYHSLGHLVSRRASSDLFGGDNCIVSPVVGLQSYNAQGECWFHLKETSSFSPAEILKQRLGTLEQTASIMARASVNRGSLKSVNRQPDYEFFLSRRR